jgi:hypothetical protein
LKTPFDAIYYPLNTNEEHVNISAACVTWVNSKVSVSAFPNPNNGRFCIRIKNAENIDAIEVKNIQGVTVYKATGNELYNEICIDITNQPTGIYLVNVSLNGKTQTTKIIKNKKT